MTDPDDPETPDEPDPPFANGEDPAALRRFRDDLQQEVYRRHVIRQIGKTLGPDDLAPTPEGAPPSPEAQNTNDEDQEHSALAAWLGLTQNGDAVEAMIAAQLVATHELTMNAMRQAITRTNAPGHAGTSVIDACRAANAALRQIETLARYRTWRSLDGKRSNGLAAP